MFKIGKDHGKGVTKSSNATPILAQNEDRATTYLKQASSFVQAVHVEVTFASSGIVEGTVRGPCDAMQSSLTLS